MAAGLPPRKGLTTLSTTPDPRAAILPCRPSTSARNAGLVATWPGELTTTTSFALRGMPMRCDSRSAPTLDCGLPRKLACVVSAPDSRALMSAKAPNRSTTQTPMVRHGWRALARATVCGEIFMGPAPRWLPYRTPARARERKADWIVSGLQGLSRDRGPENRTALCDGRARAGDRQAEAGRLSGRKPGDCQAENRMAVCAGLPS